MKAELVAERLRKWIAYGSVPIGGKLPTEPELASRYTVGLNTVRRAVALLVAEGIVVRRQGSGTYVVSLPPLRHRRLIGVVVPSTSSGYPKVIEGIERRLTAAEVGVMLASSEDEPGLERDQTRRLVENGVEGLILAPSSAVTDDPAAHGDWLRQLPVPYVLVDRRPPQPAPDDQTSFVTTNHLGGVHTAIRHLAGLGHTRIGFAARAGRGNAALVAEGFRRAIELLGLAQLPEAQVLRPDWTSEQIEEFAVLCRDESVTAVFCHSDREAATLASAARRMGWRIPGDLSLVTYDDDAAELVDPPLTAVAQPKLEIGALAAELLLRVIDEPATPAHRIELQPRLTVRASCSSPSATRRGAASRVKAGKG